MRFYNFYYLGIPEAQHRCCFLLEYRVLPTSKTMENTFIVWLMLFFFFYTMCNGIPFQVGLGGGIQTKGSLLSIDNQTISVEGLTLDLYVDPPARISCEGFRNGPTSSLFCPDPYLYYRWEILFYKLFMKHSHLNFVNFNQQNVTRQDIVFDCPAGGTILAYGDRRCAIELPDGTRKDEMNTDKCDRLVPLVLPSKSKVFFRDVMIVNGDTLRAEKLPCVAPMYICGFGVKSDIKSIHRTQHLPILEVNTHPDFDFLPYPVVRDTKYDCLVGKYEKNGLMNIPCIYHLNPLNTHDFNTNLTSFFNKTTILINKNATDESNPIDISVDKNQTMNCVQTSYCIAPENKRTRNFCEQKEKTEVVAIDRDYYNKRTDYVFNNASSSITLVQKSKQRHNNHDEEPYVDFITSQIDNLRMDHIYLVTVLVIMCVVLFIYALVFIIFVYYTRRHIAPANGKRGEEKYVNIPTKCTLPVKSVYQNIEVDNKPEPSEHDNLNEHDSVLIYEDDDVVYEEPMPY